MKGVLQCAVIFLATILHAGTSKPFAEGQVIEQVLLILDVDGVVRDGIGAVADERVISEVKTLLSNPQVSAAFISGTPVNNDDSLEMWRRGNLPLSAVFGSAFQEELSSGKVAIYGVLGGQCMRADGTHAVLDAYGPECAFELARHLLHAFLKEVKQNAEHKALCVHLERALDAITLKNLEQGSSVSPIEFAPVVEAIQEHFDPEFRLICNGALIETHTSNPPWKTGCSVSWLQDAIDTSPYLQALGPHEKRMAAGYAKRAGKGLNYMLISKTHKGIASAQWLEQKLQEFPDALIVTIGDTAVDFPMHRNAHIAFHVGLEKVWKEHKLDHCVMVRGSAGEESQHVEGTVKVLQWLRDAIGKPFVKFDE